MSLFRRFTLTNESRESGAGSRSTNSQDSFSIHKCSPVRVPLRLACVLQARDDRIVQSFSDTMMHSSRSQVVTWDRLAQVEGPFHGENPHIGGYIPHSRCFKKSYATASRIMIPKDAWSEQGNGNPTRSGILHAS